MQSSAFKFKVGDDKLRELLLQWWPEVVSAQQLKANGPDQRGFIIGGVRLEHVKVDRRHLW